MRFDHILVQVAVTIGSFSSFSSVLGRRSLLLPSVPLNLMIEFEPKMSMFPSSVIFRQKVVSHAWLR